MIIIKSAIINELIVNDDTADIELHDCKIETIMISSHSEDVMQETQHDITNIKL